MTRGFARARANIALAKYWGKCDGPLNLPAVPSVSLTLDALVTETEVVRDPDLAADLVSLDGVLVEGPGQARVARFVDLVRTEAGIAPGSPGSFCQITSRNHFPSASGLASSASGFAALAGAASRAFSLDPAPSTLSSLARRGSASAARSVFGGWCELPAGLVGDNSLAARPLHGPDHWDVAMVLALVTTGPKAVASRDGMAHTVRTSPLWPGWLASAPGYFVAVREAVGARDLQRLGEAMEASTFAMHASAWAAVPGVRYIKGVTLDLLDRVEALRQQGFGAWATMDAGPHVKVLCMAPEANRVAEALRTVPGVIEARVARPGAGIEVS